MAAAARCREKCTSHAAVGEADDVDAREVDAVAVGDFAEQGASVGDVVDLCSGGRRRVAEPLLLEALREGDDGVEGVEGRVGELGLLRELRGGLAFAVEGEDQWLRRGWAVGRGQVEEVGSRVGRDLQCLRAGGGVGGLAAWAGVRGEGGREEQRYGEEGGGKLHDAPHFEVGWPALPSFETRGLKLHRAD